MEIQYLIKYNDRMVKAKALIFGILKVPLHYSVYINEIKRNILNQNWKPITPYHAFFKRSYTITPFRIM